MDNPAFYICGHFEEAQWISTQMSNNGQILKQFVKYIPLSFNSKPCEVMKYDENFNNVNPACAHFM